MLLLLMNQRRALLTLMTTLLLASAPLAQALPEPMLQPERVLLAPGAVPWTQERVRQAIVEGAARHGWTLSGEEPGVLSLLQDQGRKYKATVDVSYDAAGFQIAYFGSVSLYYRKGDGTQRPKIHPLYNRWITDLSQAIVAEAGRMKNQVSGEPR